MSELAKPAESTDEGVRDWLADHGLHEVNYSVAKNWIHVETSVGAAELLLDAENYLYLHKFDGTAVLRTPHWSLPSHLHEYVEAVHPTKAFLHTKRITQGLAARSKVPPIGLGEDGSPTYVELLEIDRAEMGRMDIPRIDDMPDKPLPANACNRLATSPLCLRTLYGTLDYTPQVPEKVRIGIVNYLDEVNNQSDIDIFLNRFRPDAIAVTHKIKTQIVAHGSNQQTPCYDRASREEHRAGG